jgi:hypothetical protein
MPFHEPEVEEYVTQQDDPLLIEARLGDAPEQRNFLPSELPTFQDFTPESLEIADQTLGRIKKPPKTRQEQKMEEAFEDELSKAVTPIQVKILTDLR